MQEALEKLRRKDRDLIAMLDGLISNNDSMGIHSLTEGQVETRILAITPEMAEKLLERNVSNRQVNKLNVNIFANEMKNGKWMFNGEAIVFDFLGNLRNGQHRLHAIIKSGTTQQMLVITGVLPASFTTMDIGGRRNGSDILSIQSVNEPKLTSGLCKFVFAYKSGIFTGTLDANRTLSNTEIYDYYQTLSNVDRSLQFASRLAKDKLAPIKILNKNQLVGFHYLFSEKNPSHAKDFLEGIYYGNNLDVDSPILAMRNKMLKAKENKNYRITNREFILLMTVAWNKWRANEKVKTLKLPRKMEDFKLELI